MPQRPYILAESNWKTVKDTNYEVVILPWGATEAHNYHLPYATDVIQCDYIAAESARLAWERGARVVVLPTIPFGVNTTQMDIKLTINMNPTTQAAVLKDIVDSLSRQGFSKLVVMNGHGGNDFRQMIREIQSRIQDMFICSLNWYQAAEWSRYFNDLGDHAGEMETSVMLHLVPDLVLPLREAGKGLNKKFRFKAVQEGWGWAPRHWFKVTEDTGIGDPSQATAGKGKAFLDEVVHKIADFFVELDQADIEDLYE